MAAAVELHGPKRHLLGGNLPEFRRDRLGFLTACAREHGDVVPLRFGVFRALFINHPNAIEQVLGNSRSFVKSFAYDMIRPVVANGLLLSEGAFWMRQRRLAQPAFQRARMGEAYTPFVVERTRSMLDAWAGGDIRDVHAEMMRLTSQVAGRAFFGADVSGAVDEVSRQLLVLTELLTARLDSVLAFSRTASRRRPIYGSVKRSRTWTPSSTRSSISAGEAGWSRRICSRDCWPPVTKTAAG
jgi:cytochrome P450